MIQRYLSRRFLGAKLLSGGDTSGRLALKQQLKCKSFRWYLENIYPESSLNTDFLNFGEVSVPSILAIRS